MSADRPRLGSAREEAERLVAAGLAVASTALHGVEANRQVRGLAEQMFGADRVRDLAAGLAGFVSASGSGSPSGPAGDGPASGSSVPGPASGSSVPGPASGSSATGPASGSSVPGPASGSSATGPASGSSATGSPTAGLSTGSADCCVCPVCRLIGALRDPSPEFAERLARAAGDLAVGISGLLRALSAAAPRPGHDASGDPWRAATTATPPTAAPEGPPAAAVDEPASAPAPAPASASKPVAKKATAKKATAKKATAKKAVRKVVREDPPDDPA